MFEKYKVLSKRELESRQEIYFEQYVMTLNVEANVAHEVAKTTIYPAAVRYQAELAGAAANCKAAGVAFDVSILEKVSSLIKLLVEKINALEQLLPSRGGHGVANAAAAAVKCAKEIKPALGELREVVDELEGVVSDDYWPLPTYAEMLFIK